MLSRVALASDPEVRRRNVVLRVDGYDPDPEDDAPHEEAFAYRLVVSVEDARVVDPLAEIDRY